MRKRLGKKVVQLYILIFDDKIMAKKFERQFIEVAIKCFAINKLNQLGMLVY